MFICCMSSQIKRLPWQDRENQKRCISSHHRKDEFSAIARIIPIVPVAAGLAISQHRRISAISQRRFFCGWICKNAQWIFPIFSFGKFRVVFSVGLRAYGHNYQDIILRGKNIRKWRYVAHSPIVRNVHATLSKIVCQGAISIYKSQFHKFQAWSIRSDRKQKKIMSVADTCQKSLRLRLALITLGVSQVVHSRAASGGIFFAVLQR